MSNKRIGQSPI